MPKGIRRNGYDEKDLPDAVKAVKEGMSLRKAEAEFGIPKSTIKDNLNKEEKKPMGRPPVQKTILTILLFVCLPCKLVPDHSGALELFLKLQNCPKFAMPHQTTYNRLKIYLVSEVCRSLGNFGHHG